MKRKTKLIKAYTVKRGDTLFIRKSVLVRWVKRLFKKLPGDVEARNYTMIGIDGDPLLYINQDELEVLDRGN